MTNKKLLLSASALVVTDAVGLILANSAAAYQGDYSVSGPNCTPKKHEAMEQAMTQNDYTAWQT